MKLGMRWFGSNDDPIPLAYLRQVPGVTQVIGALFDVPVGEPWPLAAVTGLRDQVAAAGLSLEVIESVNVHDDIKTGGPGRDWAIENYLTTIRNLARIGVKVICYNFMPVFDWVRTDLRHRLPDGSFTMAYRDELVQGTAQETMARMQRASGGHRLPGWEPERLADLQRLLDAYAPIGEQELVDNLKYFIQAIMPTCEQVNVRMAIHPDDPPRSLFGLPRIVKDVTDMRRIESFHDSPHNGFTLCTGSLGENPANSVPGIIREFVGRDKVPFVQLRNIKFISPTDFYESAHPSPYGSLDMYEIVRALYEAGFDGYARPDHGRDIWGERRRPGYGLHDRALGIAYLTGLWEAIGKAAPRR